MKNTVKRLTTIFFIIGLVMMVSGVALAVFTYNADSSQIYAIEGGSVRIQFNDYNVGYYTESIGMPMTLNEAINNIDPKTFTITTVNNSDKYIVVYINMDLKTSSPLKKNMLNYALYRDGECIAEATSIPQTGQIAIERIAPNRNQTSEQVYNYELYVWLDYRVTVSSQAQNSRSLYYIDNQTYSNTSFNYTLNVDAKDTGYINYHCKEGSYYCPQPTILDGSTDHISKASPFYTDINYENTFIGYATSQEKADRGEVEYYPGDPIAPVTDLYAAYTRGLFPINGLSLPNTYYADHTKVVYKYITEEDFIKEASVPENTYSNTNIYNGYLTNRTDEPIGKVFMWINGTTLYIGAPGHMTNWKAFNAYMYYDNKITDYDINNFNPFNSSYSQFFYYSRAEKIDLEFFAYGILGFRTFYSCDKLKVLDFSKCDKLTVNTSYLDGTEGCFSYCDNLEKIIFPNHYIPSPKSMQKMFYSCTCLKEVDISMFDTKNVTNMANLFGNCKQLRTIYVGKYFNTSSLSTYSDLYTNCPYLQGGAGHFAVDLNPKLIDPVSGMGQVGSWNLADLLKYFRPDTPQVPGVLTYKEL